ncbi:MAG: hypothetical protein AAB433_22700 [Nitrospirota bacterium]
MHEAEPYGHLRLNGHDVGIDALGRMMGTPAKQLRQYLDELEAAGVFSRTSTGTIYSRRMVRDEALRAKRADGGHLSLQNPAVPRKKDVGKDTIKDTFQPSIPPSLQGSPSSSSSSSSSSSTSKKKEEMPPAVAVEFDEYWSIAPMRNGKRLGKSEAARKFSALSVEDRKHVLLAAKHYAESKQVKDGIGIMDPHRFLRKGKDEPWRDWIEPEQAPPTNGHGQSLTCTKRIQGHDDRFLRPCGQPASPESRPNEPRCPEHLRAVPQLQQVTHAAQ